MKKTILTALAGILLNGVLSLIVFPLNGYALSSLTTLEQPLNASGSDPVTPDPEPPPKPPKKCKR